MTINVPFALAALLALACAEAPITKTYVIRPPGQALEEPRTVVFVNSGDAKETMGLSAVALDLGEVLRARGFLVKRFAKEDSSVHYGLELRGGITRRCGDGAGYEFELLEVYVVDLARNEQVMAVGGSRLQRGLPVPGQGGDALRGPRGSAEGGLAAVEAVSSCPPATPPREAGGLGTSTD